MKPPTPPKGSLEDLFRHHLLESEAAVAPPRPHVWEQLDNSLLLAQNEQYRRRLRTHRWAIAASLLLASLAGGGWWHSQLAPAPTLATATPQAADRPGLAAARRAAPAGPAARRATAATITATPNLATANQAAIEETSTLAPVALPPTSLAGGGLAGPAAAAGRRGRPQAAAARRATLALAPAGPGYGSAASPAGAAAAGLTGVPSGAPALAASAKYGRPAGSLPPEAAAGTPSATAAGTLASVAADPAATAATPAGAADLLATRDANLALATVALPPSLDPVPVTMPLPELARQWQFGLGYAVSAFQPNIDFAKATATYGSFAAANAFAASSAVALARPATVEYRQALHHGLGQRLSLWATRRLGASRWGLRAGLELAQYSAGSAGSAVYEGGQVTDLAYTQALQPRAQRTTYRYRTASVSAEARYSNPVKSGFSLYGRVGALLTTLLSAHSEVQGVPEASSNYTLSSPSSPYRMLTGGLRGGGGLQYRPAGHQWALSLGPVAEMGILSLNTDSGQDFWHQARPYSFGLEAGLELGRSPRVP